MAYSILIIDEEPTQRDLLIHCLQNRLGYLITASTYRDAAELFRSENYVKPDIILMGLSRKPDAEINAQIKMLSIHSPVVALVTYGDYETGLAALGAGAQDFLTRPVAMERLGATFRNILLMRDMRHEVERLRQGHQDVSLASHVNEANPFFPLIGEDGNIRKMEEIEADAIRFAMQFYSGRMTEVARRLGIGRSTLYRKVSEFSLRHHSEAA